MTSPLLMKRPIIRRGLSMLALMAASCAGLLLLVGAAPAQYAPAPPPVPAPVVSTTGQTFSYFKKAQAAPAPAPLPPLAPLPPVAPAGVQPVVFQQPVPKQPPDKQPGTLEEESTRYQIQVQLEPPGPQRLFQLESEAQLRERIRQEGRERYPPERIAFP